MRLLERPRMRTAYDAEAILGHGNCLSFLPFVTAVFQRVSEMECQGAAEDVAGGSHPVGTPYTVCQPTIHSQGGEVSSQERIVGRHGLGFPMPQGLQHRADVLER
jgi:hypothetical protein